MNYFDNILYNRGYAKCPLPLWNLKIPDEEFKELQEILAKRTHIINMENPFLSVCIAADLRHIV